MEINEIKQFSKRMHKKLEQYYNFDDPKKLNFPMTVKIMEELGELCDAVLGKSGLQRKAKLEQFTQENLEEEFADVITCVFILAENMDIDVEEGLRRKIKKIDQRFAEE